MGLFEKFFGPPSREKFARRFLEELQTCGYEGDLEYDAENYCLREGSGGKKVSAFNLSNFYLEHCKLSRSQRKKHIRHSVVACLSARQELPDEYEHARPDLRLKLWSRAAIAKLELQQEIDRVEKGIDFVLDYVGMHLCMSVVLDYPNSVRTINRETIENWGVPVYQAIEDARQNLMEDNFAFAALGETFYASVTGDSYDSSRILLLDLIRKLEVEGDYVAMVPSRDTLLLTGSEDEAGLTMMLRVAEEATQDPRPMLFMPLRLEGDLWVDWMPTATHPLYDRFRLLELQYLQPEYEEQKALLEQLHESNGTDVFVASYTAVRKEDGSVFSYCVWSKDVDTLLPKAQQILFFEEGKDIVADGEWDHIASIVGDLMEETDDYPPRYRVRSFPNEEQLAAIGGSDETE